MVSFGRYVWVSSEMNGSDGVIIALSNIKFNRDKNIDGKVEFHKVLQTKDVNESSYEILKLDYEIPIDSIFALESAKFVKGDFIW